MSENPAVELQQMIDNRAGGESPYVHVHFCRVCEREFTHVSSECEEGYVGGILCGSCIRKLREEGDRIKAAA